MDYKEALAEIEKLENGADIITAIKTETGRLGAEAKNHRLSGEKASGKLKSLLSNLGLEDTDDVADKAKELKTTLDAFNAGGKSPDEVQKQVAALTKQLDTVKTQLTDMTQKAETEKGKRIAALKHSLAVDALTKGNAASPEAMAKLLDEYLVVGDDEKVIYKFGDKEMSVADGVKGWLTDNAWAVKANAQSGGGASVGGAGSSDPFLSGLN